MCVLFPLLFPSPSLPFIILQVLFIFSLFCTSIHPYSFPLVPLSFLSWGLMPSYSTFLFLFYLSFIFFHFLVTFLISFFNLVWISPTCPFSSLSYFNPFFSFLQSFLFPFLLASHHLWLNCFLFFPSFFLTHFCPCPYILSHVFVSFTS